MKVNKISFALENSRQRALLNSKLNSSVIAAPAETGNFNSSKIMFYIIKTVYVGPNQDSEEYEDCDRVEISL